MNRMTFACLASLADLQGD